MLISNLPYVNTLQQTSMTACGAANVRNAKCVEVKNYIPKSDDQPVKTTQNIIGQSNSVQHSLLQQYCHFPHKIPEESDWQSPRIADSSINPRVWLAQLYRFGILEHDLATDPEQTIQTICTPRLLALRDAVISEHSPQSSPTWPVFYELMHQGFSQVPQAIAPNLASKFTTIEKLHQCLQALAQDKSNQDLQGNFLQTLDCYENSQKLVSLKNKTLAKLLTDEDPSLLQDFPQAIDTVEPDLQPGWLHQTSHHSKLGQALQIPLQHCKKRWKEESEQLGTLPLIQLPQTNGAMADLLSAYIHAYPDYFHGLLLYTTYASLLALPATDTVLAARRLLICKQEAVSPASLLTLVDELVQLDALQNLKKTLLANIEQQHKPAAGVAFRRLKKYPLDERVLNEYPLINVPFQYQQTLPHILEQFFQSYPALIVQMMANLACEEAEHRREFETYYVAMELAQSANGSCSTAFAKQWFAACSNSRYFVQLSQQLEKQVALLYGQRLLTELENLELNNPPCFAGRSCQELLQLRDKFRTLEEIQNRLKFKLNLIFTTLEPFTTAIDGRINEIKPFRQQVSSQLLSIWLNAEQQRESAQRKWFRLAVPTTEQINNIFSHGNDDEKQFFNCILSYIDALYTFQSNDSHEHLVKFRQCQYDVYQAQLQLQIAMTRQLIKFPNQMHSLRVSNDLQENIQLIRQLAQERKAIGPRVADDQFSPYITSVVSIFWQSEDDIEDIIGDLYYEKLLVDLKYDFASELKRALGCNPITYANEIINQLIYKRVFQTEKFCKTLTSIYEVAQQSPRLFRRRMGDFAMLYPQLKNLLTDSSVIDSTTRVISSCFRGQAMAASFTNDAPRPIQVSEETAFIIKQFEMYYTLASTAHKAMTFSSVVEFVLFHEPRKLCQHVLPKYLADFCFKSLKPPLIRLLHSLRCAEEFIFKITDYLPEGFLPNMNLQTLMARTRHVAQFGGVTKGTITYYLSLVFQPLLNQFTTFQAYYQQVALDNSPHVWHLLREEWKAFTGAVVAATLITTVAVGLIHLTGGLLLFASAGVTTVLSTLVIFTCCLQNLLRLRQNVDSVRRPVQEAIDQYIARAFAKDRPQVQQARQQAHAAFEDIMGNVAKDQQEHQLCLMLADYWELYLNKDQHADQIANTLSYFAPSLDQDAQKILHIVQDLEKIKQALAGDEQVLGSAENIQLFNQSLHNESFALSPASAGEVAYQMQLRIIMIESILVQSCGTHIPGMSAATIRSTLEQYKIKTLRGKHILELLKQRDEMRLLDSDQPGSTGLNAINLDEQRKKLQNNEARWWEEKMELLMKKAIRNVFISHFKEHSNTTEDELNQAANNPLLQQKLVIELQKIQLMSRKKTPAF